MRHTGQNFTYTDDFGFLHVSCMIDLNAPPEHTTYAEASSEEPARSLAGRTSCANTHLRANGESEL